MKNYLMKPEKHQKTQEIKEKNIYDLNSIFAWYLGDSSIISLKKSL